jgi:putative hydrolase of the HAD superfamily
MGMSSHELEKLFYSGSSGDRCQLGEITFEQHVQNVRGELNLSPDEMDSVIEQFWAGDRLDQDLVNYIRNLHDRYRTGLLSNAFSDLREWLKQQGEVDGVFDELVISAEVGIVKPDPRIYYLALDQLKVVPEEAIFIDDFNHNIEGAMAVGMHAIKFINPDQTRSELEELLYKGTNPFTQPEN